jgi:hypothetical protein
MGRGVHGRRRHVHDLCAAEVPRLMRMASSLPAISDLGDSILQHFDRFLTLRMSMMNALFFNRSMAAVSASS